VVIGGQIGGINAETVPQLLLVVSTRHITPPTHDTSARALAYDFAY